MTLTLYGYWRSSAAYRVRLALAWKGLSATAVPVDIRTGIQSGPDYLALNPQALVPVLVDGDAVLSQSLAIIEYLEDAYPQPPLLPADPIGRARVRAAALMITADIHPLNNLRVGNYLKSVLGHDQTTVDVWSRHWISAGLEALESFASVHGGRFLHGDSLSMADICLIPQLYNARRVSTDILAYPRLLAVEMAVLAQDFAAVAYPDDQPDASPA